MHERANVPCGTCRLCCKSELLMLLPDEGDVVSTYEHEIVVLPGTEISGPVLKKKANGDCVYLGDGGCTIHDRAPVICRVFDCRRWFLNHSRQERRVMIKRRLASADVFAAGRARIGSLAGDPL